MAINDTSNKRTYPFSKLNWVLLERNCCISCVPSWYLDRPEVYALIGTYKNIKEIRTKSPELFI